MFIHVVRELLCMTQNTTIAPDCLHHLGVTGVSLQYFFPCFYLKLLQLLWIKYTSNIDSNNEPHNANVKYLIQFRIKSQL